MAAKKKEIVTEKVEKVEEVIVKVMVKIAFFDMQLMKNVYYGEILEVAEARADELVSKGLVVKV